MQRMGRRADSVEAERSEQEPEGACGDRRFSLSLQLRESSFLLSFSSSVALLCSV